MLANFLNEKKEENSNRKKTGGYVLYLYDLNTSKKILKILPLKVFFYH